MRMFIVMPSCTEDPDTIWDSPLLKLIKGEGTAVLFEEASFKHARQIIGSSPPTTD